MNKALETETRETELKNQEEAKQVNQIITGKGSVYAYLPDGRTQRYKNVEGKSYEPQDAMVFVPDWAWVSKNAPKNVLDQLGENETQYEQTILGFVHGKRNKIYIVDSRGNKLESNQAILEAEGPIFLWFGHEETKDSKETIIQNFSIPLAAKPKIGYYTFDTRKYKKDETTMREVHIGNKVKEITYK